MHRSDFYECNLIQLEKERCRVIRDESPSLILEKDLISI